MDRAYRSEHIVMAAIHYEDGIKREHQPTNVKSGIVVGGLRHTHCLMTLHYLLGENYKVSLAGPRNQGFVTSNNRFVFRKEALTIAIKRNQLICNPHNPRIGLFSEDLY